MRRGPKKRSGARWQRNLVDILGLALELYCEVPPQLKKASMIDVKSLIDTLVDRYPQLSVCADDVSRTFELLTTVFVSGGKILVCGNGGSAADSDHIVAELMKGFKLPRPVPTETREWLLEAFPSDGAYLADHLQGALPAISLVGQAGLMSAFANDVAADMVFAQQVLGYGAPGDVLLGISTSGNSANVVNALKVARALGLRTAGLTGGSGGRMTELCDVAVRVPAESTSEVQELHLPVYHVLCEMLEVRFFGSGLGPGKAGAS